jgi:hypothetical protein
LIELMDSVFAPDTLPGRPKGRVVRLNVRVVNDPVARNSFLTEAWVERRVRLAHFWADRSSHCRK